MKLKTSELQGKALDYAVAVAEGGEKFAYDGITMGFVLLGRSLVLNKGWNRMSYCPSIDWAEGGPIIERELIHLVNITGQEWLAKPAREIFYHKGETALIAAMRCYVASKLGDVVDIPEELNQK